MNKILQRELELLDQEKVKDNFSTNTKKAAFVEELKTGLGPNIKEKIVNPDRHNPKKMSLWDKFKKAIGIC